VTDAKKNPNNVIRHVLCAETDQERDQWVDALMLYVGKDSGGSAAGADRDRTGKKSSDDPKPSSTSIKDFTSKGNEKFLPNQDPVEGQARSVSSSVSNQQAGGRGGSLPHSPTIQGGPFDDRQSTERPSAEAQPAPISKGNSSASAAQQLPRNPTSQSFSQDDVSSICKCVLLLN